MKNKNLLILLIIDSLVLAFVTLAGFATHGEAGSAGLRMLTTFIPLLAGWFLIAPFFGVYDLARAGDLRQLWRPFYAMVLGGPFAGWLRGVLLGNAPVLPLFVVVLGGFSALAILAWRALYALFIARRVNRYG
ncbi:MAG: DUF3054 domain-containing protein [Anaerolineales bacterium]|jgi:hypothetical protein|nr:DUF3054 domain-containing protein [Anaerolineales bacterium]